MQQKLYSILLIFTSCFYFSLVHASTWVVATSGGNYTTIYAAITNASTLTGDTIYVLNSAVGSGYQGTTRIKETTNIAITNKSLTIMPYYGDTLFFTQSQWTITPSTPIVVDIIGMNDSAGGAAAGQAAFIASGGPGTAAGNRSFIQIFGSQIGTGTGSAAACGYINFGSYDFWDYS